MNPATRAARCTPGPVATPPLPAIGAATSPSWTSGSVAGWRCSAAPSPTPTTAQPAP
ncbi:hypothetical protein DVS28_b0305 (plasmid) [Euzebya pacifica]|uniref:Uncharacterized protein n=1 Tax=Euzebya pacifica TaxID=1608957 RepID=A0A346Y6H8_9ACTN|nr:hypothetical protein DVS28_b0305 [Euzebya pacifica]